MKTAFIAVATFLAGVALGVMYGEATYLYLRRQVREPRAGQRPTETMKRVVWACVLNGFAWVWFSYILAALDKDQIAEELSKVALAEIIVPVAVYALKSGVENLSKNNHWPDKPGAPDDTPEDTDPPGAG